MIDDYCPIVAQCLSGAGLGLEPEMIARMTPIVTELLLRQTKAQLRLEEESRTQRPTQPKLKASKLRKMCKGRLLGVVDRYDLHIDIDELSGTKRKAPKLSLQIWQQ
jgi:hypothetical protein